MPAIGLLARSWLYLSAHGMHLAIQLGNVHSLMVSVVAHRIGLFAKRLETTNEEEFNRSSSKCPDGLQRSKTSHHLPHQILLLRPDSHPRPRSYKTSRVRPYDCILEKYNATHYVECSFKEGATSLVMTTLNPKLACPSSRQALNHLGIWLGNLKSPREG